MKMTLGGLMPLRLLDLSTYFETYSAYDCGVKRPFTTHQTTNPLIARPLSEKYLLCMEMRCACFELRHSTYSNDLCCAPDAAAVGTIFYLLVNERMRYVVCHSRGFIIGHNHSCFKVTYPSLTHLEIATLNEIMLL